MVEFLLVREFHLQNTSDDFFRNPNNFLEDLNGAIDTACREKQEKKLKILVVFKKTIRMLPDLKKHLVQLVLFLI